MTLDRLAPFGDLGPSKGVASHAALGLAANMAPVLVELGYRINLRWLVHNPWLLATLHRDFGGQRSGSASAC